MADAPINTLSDFMANYLGSEIQFSDGNAGQQVDDPVVNNANYKITSANSSAVSEVTFSGDYQLNSTMNADLEALGKLVKETAAEQGVDLMQLKDVKAAAQWDGNAIDLSDAEMGALVAGYGMIDMTQSVPDGNAFTILSPTFNFATGLNGADQRLGIALGAQVYGDNHGNVNGVGTSMTELNNAAAESQEEFNRAHATRTLGM